MNLHHEYLSLLPASYELITSNPNLSPILVGELTLSAAEQSSEMHNEVDRDGERSAVPELLCF
jgi:hypothetical protein